MKNKKYALKIDKKESSKSTLPAIEISIQEYEGEILKFGEYIDTKVFKMFRQYCETIEAFSAVEAVFKADGAMYRDTLKCISNIVIVHPDSSAYTVLLKMQEDKDMNKRILLSRSISVEEMFFIHVDELLFPAQSTFNYLTGIQEVRMVNESLVKRVVLFDSDYLEDASIRKAVTDYFKTREGQRALKDVLREMQEEVKR